MSARTVVAETLLDADADTVWAALRRPETFRHVLGAVLSIPALGHWQGEFREGDTGSGWLFLFHVLPLHRHTIELHTVDHASRTMATHEHGGVLRRWDHTLHVEPAGDGRARYRDTIVVDSGPLTFVSVAFARAIFRYRHRRWRALARRLSRAAPG